MKWYKKFSTAFLPIATFFLGIIATNIITSAFAHGGNANFIHACVKNSNGSLRIIAATDTCGNGETSLDWNAQGLPGTGVFVSNNLSGGDFQFADFRYRNLNGVNLSDTFLKQAIFSFADLRNADLTNARVPLTRFDHADLRGAIFTGMDMGVLVSFNYANLSGQDFSNFNFPGDLPGPNFDHAILTNTNFSTRNLYGIVFTAANLTDSNLSSTTATRNGEQKTVSFSEANLTRSNFTGASLPGSDFSLTTINQTNFTNANLTGAIFTDATITNPVWSNTTCPDGTNSNDNGNTCVGHGV